ncbi:MAG: septal ring lytic transglycosylase RlpA family protein [Nitrospinota bacterium]|nr:septal ring lytic transglycosylase RlpA family protein [Nitrospinota bacterium]
MVCYSLAGLVSGCASHPTTDVKSQPVFEAQSSSAQTLPYRVEGRVYYPMGDSSGFVQEGTASWYGPDFHAKRTSNGEVYNMNALTAAHKTLPFGSLVRVDHQETGRTVTVRINDRGPFVGDRIIDLSYGAAKKLGMIEKGTAPVKLQVIRGATAPPPRNAAGTLAKKALYSVQVGVFENLDNARKIAHQFDNSRIFTVKQKDQRFFKVLVGKYSNYEKALGPMDHIRLRGFKEAFIVLSP